MMNKNKLAYLKRKLLKSIKIDEMWLRKIPGCQRMALVYFFLQPDDTHYVFYVIEEMKVGRDELIRSGVPEDKLPEKLRGADWEERIWKKFGMEPPVETPNPPSKEVSSKREEVVSSPVEERSEPIRKKFGDPFKSDSWGQLLGEEEEGIRPSINKVKIY